MVKYVFNVYDRETGEKISSVVTNCDYMIDTMKTLNELGMVKGYILDDSKENEDDN